MLKKEAREVYYLEVNGQPETDKGIKLESLGVHCLLGKRHIFLKLLHIMIVDVLKSQILQIEKLKPISQLCLFNNRNGLT